MSLENEREMIRRPISLTTLLFQKHPKERPIPLSLEQAGKPSKMITLIAMRVLNRLGGNANEG
jgi:hypothetical protein